MDSLPLAHHPTAPPSSWGRRYLCPASAIEERRTLSTADSGGERGSDLHRCALETGDLDGLSDFDRHAVTSFLAWEESIRERHAIAADAFAHTEHRLDILDPNGEALSFGTADRVIVAADEAIVLDLKTHASGSLPETSTMLQLLGYALGVHDLYQVERVHAYAYAPHGPSEYRFTLERADLDRYRAFVVRLLAEPKPDAPYRPSAEACQYCPARGRCKASMALVAEMEVLLRDFDGSPLIRATDVAYEIADDAALAKFWDKLRVAEKAIEEAKKFVRKALACGAESQTLELKQRSGALRWRRPQVPAWSALPAAVREKVGMSDYWPLVSLSPTQLKDAYARAAQEGGTTIAQAKRDYDAHMAQLVEPGEPTAYVAPRKGVKLLED